MLSALENAIKAGVPVELLLSMMISMAAAAFILGVIWRADREPYLLLWSLGWAMYAMRFSELLLLGTFDLASPFAFFGMLRDACFVVGAAQYVGARWWRVPLLLLAAEGLVHVTPLAHAAFVAPYLGAWRLLVSGLAFSTVVVVLWTASRTSPVARRVSAVGFAVGLLGVAILPLGGSTNLVEMGALLEVSALAAALGLAFSALDGVAADRLEALHRLEGTMQHALRGHANVCDTCHRIESPAGWTRPEEFVRHSTQAQVSHGICPPCAEREFGIPIAGDGERR